MTGEVIVDTSSFDRLMDRLAEASDLTQAGGIRDGHLEASDKQFDHLRQRFDVFSDRGGDWEEHAPSTQKRRGEGAPILIETGQLRESMERDDIGHVLEVTDDTVTEGTEDRTARIHQDGTDTVKISFGKGGAERVGGIPARPIIVEPDAQALQEMQDAIAQGLRDEITIESFR